MISQQWVVAEGGRINTVHHIPDSGIPTGTVILLPGFLHAMCDMDYFMSRLAKRLAAENFFVVQADLRGHGDNPYPAETIDLNSLQKDIRTLIRYYRSRMPGPLFGVGRGLTATLLAASKENVLLTGLAGIAPYCIDPRVMAGALAPILDTAGPGIIDAYEAFPGNDYVQFSDFEPMTLTLLHALGALAYNLHGLEISRRLLEDLANFDPLPALKNAGSKHQVWLFDEPGINTGCTAMPFGERRHHLEPDRYLKSIPARDPQCQEHFITALQDWLLNISLN
jgi:pimeloyl-ACP methyl ester carboxylesterase